MTPGVEPPTLVAVDLDRTLIYSARALDLTDADHEAPRLVVAEVYRREPLSYYTREAERLLQRLSEVAVLMPTTTRTVAQYRRVVLPGGVPPFAVTSNGGRLLVDGVVDPEWSAHVGVRLAAHSAPLEEVVAHLEAVADERWVRKRRVAEGLFCYLVVDRAELPRSLVEELGAWCAERGWQVSLQGRKLYCVPAPLTKASAIGEVRRRTGALRLLAAGDSLLDAPMLQMADEAIRPAHGELHDAGWRAVRVTVTACSGVLGGEEVAAWLLARALEARPRLTGTAATLQHRPLADTTTTLPRPHAATAHRPHATAVPRPG